MGNLFLLLLTFTFLVDVARAQSTFMDPAMPVGAGQSVYGDPDGMLSSLCNICGVSFLACNHRYAPFMGHPPMQRFINASDLLMHPEWPRDPEQNGIEALPAPQVDHNRRQPLQHAYVQTLNDGAAIMQPDTMQVWAELNYNPGDRTAPQRRSPPKKGGFPCMHPECNKVFDRQCDLRRHIKVHLDKSKRPYKCTQCEEAFVYPKDLDRHQRTHRVPQKTFCPVQGCTNTAGFSRRDNYQRHMRNQHPNAALIAQLPM